MAQREVRLIVRQFNEILAPNSGSIAPKDLPAHRRVIKTMEKADELVLGRAANLRRRIISSASSHSKSSEQFLASGPLLAAPVP